MKKLLISVLVFILLFLCVVPISYATSEPATLSEDYQTLTLDGNTYSRYDISLAMSDSYKKLDYTISLSNTQKETIKEVELEANGNNTLVYADIYFKDGTTLSVGFLQDSIKDEFINLIDGQGGNYVIDFEYPKDNVVTVSPNKLYGEQLLLNANQLEYCDYFYVKSFIADNNIYVCKGIVIIVDDTYYFACFKELDVNDPYDFEPYNCQKLTVHKITDSEVITSIQDGEDTYYGEDFGFLLDGDLGKDISSVFLTIVFAVVPFIIFVVFLILAIRSKTVYKKLFRFIYLLSGFELIIFAGIALLITLNQ